MDIFFAGNHFGNTGPRIVNKNFIRCLKNDVFYITSENKALRFFEVVWKTLYCKAIIFSGVTSYDHLIIPICRFLRKRIIFIMHGFLKFEDEVNNFTNHRGEKNEALLLKNADLILCVSETFMLFIKKQFPHYSHKLSFLTNGVDWGMLDSIAPDGSSRDKRRIIMLGGGRKTKRNLEVCQAVALLYHRFHEELVVDVYGDFQENDQSRAISEMPFVTFHSLISHDKLLERFQSSSLFIQNSDFESFSLGVVEALVCGCNVLISKNVGAKDIIPGLMPDDIITDTSDIEEISYKINNLMNSTGNNDRLLSSIDKKDTSIQASANKLLSFVSGFLERK